MNDDLNDANLAHLLAARAASHPDAIALCETRRGRERTATFAELERLSARGAALLHGHGLRAGDAVLVFQPMSIDLYVALMAIFRLGLTAMFADPSAGRKFLDHCCAIGQPRGFLGPPKAHALRLVSGALRGIEAKFVTGACFLPMPGATRWERLRSCPPREPIEPTPSDAPALLTFTSGSTGEPKAAVRTHGFLRAQHAALEENIDLRPGEIDLATLPIFALANLASGVASILPDADLRRPGFVDPAPIARQIERWRPTRCTASPAFFERLLDGGAPLGNFRKVYTGGAPVFPGLIGRLREALRSDATIVAVYGSTEAEPMARLSENDIAPEDLEAMRTGRGLLAGMPVSAVRLRVIADRWGEPLGRLSPEAFDALRCAPGAAGEIVATGEHVLKGYLHGTGDAETKFQVGAEIWHRTGDAGALDDSGRLWLLGRCAAKVRDADGSVTYPLAVECVARLLAPWLRQCAFLAVEGERWLMAEPRENPSPAEVDHLTRSLAWARIDRIPLVPQIPVDRRHNAKIDYPALRETARRLQFDRRRVTDATR